jgi:hypothetical protein
MFGKSLSEYIHFQRVILGLILVVGLARLGLSLGGVPNESVKWLSITAVMILGLLYYSVAVHTTGFGSYKQLYPLILIQSILGSLVIIAGIVLAIFTGHDNVFTAPEYSPTADGKTWFHVLGHVIAGFIVLPLVGWLVGSIILAITRKAVPHSTRASAA